MEHGHPISSPCEPSAQVSEKCSNLLFTVGCFQTESASNHLIQFHQVSFDVASFFPSKEFGCILGIIRTTQNLHSKDL